MSTIFVDGKFFVLTELQPQTKRCIDMKDIECKNTVGCTTKETKLHD